MAMAAYTSAAGSNSRDATQAARLIQALYRRRMRQRQAAGWRAPPAPAPAARADEDGMNGTLSSRVVLHQASPPWAVASRSPVRSPNKGPLSNWFSARARVEPPQGASPTVNLLYA